MQGELTAVWNEVRREIWVPLVDSEDIPIDIYCELYRCVASNLRVPPSSQALADLIDSPVLAREAFENLNADDFAGERSLVASLEAIYAALDEIGGDQLSNRYFALLAAFIEKFSLRYDLRRPCVLCPTLPGLFTSLISELRAAANTSAHLDMLMKEFENAVRDLRHDCTESRIKICIQKQVNLLEGIGQTFPGVTADTLGMICDQVGTWPHAKLKEAMKDLYKFTCDYPGIRHGGKLANASRAVDMRDLIAISIVLAGFTPYLREAFNPDILYRGT